MKENKFHFIDYQENNESFLMMVPEFLFQRVDLLIIYINREVERLKEVKPEPQKYIPGR